MKWNFGQRNGLRVQPIRHTSENLCSRFCSIDTKEFGVIDGVTDRGYYTNSFHLDVQKKVNPYDKIDFEMPYPENLAVVSSVTVNSRTVQKRASKR
ncbi:hypothetical protein O9992_29000 [Vibrio lentus]|nr:hypothetical protein [Vibrio lentus]